MKKLLKLTLCWELILTGAECLLCTSYTLLIKTLSFLLVTKMSVDELHQLNGQLLKQIQSKCLLFYYH